MQLFVAFAVTYFVIYQLDCPDSPIPEMKDASTCISVGTITEPDCLGPCEPGTSVMLEGIVWQETEGGNYNYSLH